MPSQDIPNDPNMTVLEQMNSDVVGVIWDRGEEKSVKGLHLRIFLSGKRCFYFLYTTKHGLRRRPKIGEGIGLSEARRIASEMRSQVYMGLDPKGQIDAKKAEKTIAEVFSELTKTYYVQTRFVESGRTAEVTNLFKSRIEKTFGGKKLSDVRSPQIRQWHMSMRKTSTIANRALEVLSKLYSYAIEQEYVERNPCGIIRAFPERKRKKVVSREDLNAILKILYRNITDDLVHDKPAAISILCLFYTGARPSVLDDARWDHIVSYSANGGAHLALPGKMSAVFGENEKLFIPPQIMSLLKKPLDEESRIFDTSRNRQLWANILKELDLKDLWIRDARKTFASIALNEGISIDLIGDALNHRSAQTTKIYAQDFDNSNERTTMAVASALDKIKLEDIL